MISRTSLYLEARSCTSVWSILSFSRSEIVRAEGVQGRRCMPTLHCMEGRASPSSTARDSQQLDKLVKELYRLESLRTILLR